jgi:hypothetical protein
LESAAAWVARKICDELQSRLNAGSLQLRQQAIPVAEQVSLRQHELKYPRRNVILAQRVALLLCKGGGRRHK